MGALPRALGKLTGNSAFLLVIRKLFAWLGHEGKEFTNDPPTYQYDQRGCDLAALY